MIVIPSYELSNDDISRIFKGIIDEIILLIRDTSYTYQSDYRLAKNTIEFAFKKSCVDNNDQFALVFERLLLIDNAYSTNMRMRPYGIGELAEAISMLGSDEVVKDKMLTFLTNKPRDYAPFDYLKSQQIKYKDGGKDRASNLFCEGYGTEVHRASDKRALSLITKYAFFLTEKKFPIYDSLIKFVYPRLWNKLCPNSPIKTMPSNIEQYIDSIDKMKHLLGGITYDELDFILWHIAKIIKGKYASILTMEDYLRMPTDFLINNHSLNKLIFIENNQLLSKLFELASILA